jgi:uncharacterized protein (DUF1778 family)
MPDMWEGAGADGRAEPTDETPATRRRNDKVITFGYHVLVRRRSFMSSARPAKRETLNLRIKPQERGLIDRAARSLGKTRTDFVLDAARRAAEDALLDRTVLTASPKAYAEFLRRLDAPPRPSERLRKTMQAKAPWD